MKIALVSEFFYPTLGGVQEHLYNVAKQYIRKGHDTKIITPQIFTRTPFKEWWPKDLPESSYVPVGYSLPFFINDSRGRMCVGLGLGKKLRNLLSPENFDIVHLHAPLNGTLPILADHFSSTHIVGTFHTSFPGIKGLKAVKHLAQKQIDKLEYVLGVSPTSIASISQYVNLRAEVIPNGIDTEVFKPRFETKTPKMKEFDDGKVNILFVGRPDIRNGLDMLIRAFGKVYPRHTNTRLIIAGGGDGIEKYKAMTSYLPKESVVFLGAIRDERAEVYRSADIHVFTVEKAAFSVTLLEGMASGLAVVTSPFEGHRAAGNPGEHFLTVPYEDSDGLAAELERLILDEKLRETLGHQAREHSLKFDWSIVADRILAVYEKVLKGQTARANTEDVTNSPSELVTPEGITV